jgi:hypothetical protein
MTNFLANSWKNLTVTSSMFTVSLLTVGSLSAVVLPAMADTLSSQKPEVIVLSDIEDPNLFMADILDALADELKGEAVSEDNPEINANALDPALNSLIESIESVPEISGDHSPAPNSQISP